jgi:hypothetical protein
MQPAAGGGWERQPSCIGATPKQTIRPDFDDSSFEERHRIWHPLFGFNTKYSVYTVICTAVS